MKTLIIGANGQLGSDIVKIFGADSFYEVVPLNHPDIDITKPDTINLIIQKYQPEMIISTAAYHRVDECEMHPEESFGVNALGVHNLCLACKKDGITLVHFSTDYVFGLDQKRNTPYTEDDAPGPQSVYAVSKLAGEYLMRYLCEKFFLIRSCGLYGSAGPSAKSGNFVDNMVKEAQTEKEVRVVNDQILTPTYTVDLAQNLKELLKTQEYGLYHITSEEQCSWYEFAEEIFKLLKSSIPLIPVATNYFYSPVQRPLYSVLDNAHLKQIGLNLMKPWRDALHRYMQEKEYLK